MIKDFAPRLYQETIFATCIEKNTLVVLPTGMGKTFIFLMLTSYRLRQYPDSKVLFIGPTRPLIEQYYDVFINHFDIDKDKLAIFTGNVNPEKRAELWQSSQVIFSTPQGLENDIINSKINFENVSLLGIDEAHKAVGNYSYVFIAKNYQKKSKIPRILGLTASPGSEVERILEVCKNLYIEEIEIRTNDDPDVKPYIKEIEIKWISVELPEEFKQIQSYIIGFLNTRIEKLNSYGILNGANVRNIPKKDLIIIQRQLVSKINSGDKNPIIWTSISVLAELMKLYHALELLETQGMSTLYNYLDKLHKESYYTNVKAIKNLVLDLNFRSALIKAKSLYERNIKHPKLIGICEFVKNEIAIKPNIKIIVFNHYRDNVIEVVTELNNIQGVKARLFVGQAKRSDTGLTQKEQKHLLEDFRNGQFNVLCCTSVGEEGLDIPQVDLVIFYEPIPSAIRQIQRRGRTGRQEKGKVVIFITKHTRDEAYKWVAHRKEAMMIRTLSSLRATLKQMVSKERQSLNNYIKTENKFKIVADYREKGNEILRGIFDSGADVKLEMLDIADYILSPRVAVEVKTTNDFINSILDGRLLSQLKNLKANFERPIIILQGNEDIYSVRNISQNAIRGMFATITIDYGIPIINTIDSKDSAELIMFIAKREQSDDTDIWSLHPNKRLGTIKDMQEYVISSLPGVGHTLAKPLLMEFGTIKNVINASKDELERIEMIGPKKANKITEIVNSRYI